MDAQTLRHLQVGDRVRHTSPAGTATGTVTLKRYGVVVVTWDDNGGKLRLHWRSRFDRERARCLELVSDR